MSPRPGAYVSKVNSFAPRSSSRQSIKADDPELVAFNQRMKNSGYDDIVNPYLNYDYTDTFWDQIGDFFGFNTFQDTLALDMQTKAREFMSNISKERFDNELNFPDAQVARMRAAGMNPDLLGTGDVQGASQFDQPIPGVSYDPTEDTKSFGASLGSAFQAAMSLTQFGSSLPMIFQNIRSAEVDRTDKIFNIASRVASKLSPDTIQEVLTGDVSKERFSDLFGDVLNWSSPKNRSSFLSALRTSIKQPATQAESFKGRFMLGESMKRLSDMENSSWFDWSYQTLNIIRQPLVDMQDTLTNLNLNYNLQKGYADYQDEANRMNYLNTAASLGLPENTARAEYEEALSRQHTAKYNSSFAQFKKSVLSKLHEDAKANPFSRFLEFCWLTGFTPSKDLGVGYGLNLIPGQSVQEAKNLTDTFVNEGSEAAKAQGVANMLVRRAARKAQRKSRRSRR